eukprot:TRINITY_DN18770_c0_g1_i2.p1 TRINITY_DN18770_c0_g1~~TRINITY_DN18770_c0_g1_i2.p1  ORF type:complete len:219 (-),score=25.93 TRINITY_DN18770_c0_g1_i2:217-873(-)
MYSAKFPHFTVNVPLTKYKLVQGLLPTTPFVLDGAVKTVLNHVPLGCSSTVAGDMEFVRVVVCGIKLRVRVLRSLPHNVLGYDVLAYWQNRTASVDGWKKGRVFSYAPLLGVTVEPLACLYRHDANDEWKVVDSGCCLSAISREDMLGEQNFVAFDQYDGHALTSPTLTTTTHNGQEVLVDENAKLGADTFMHDSSELSTLAFTPWAKALNKLDVPKD